VNDPFRWVYFGQFITLQNSTIHSVVLAYHMLNCESALESWKLSQSIATSNRTQRTATVIPFRSVAIRVAIRYAYSSAQTCIRHPKCTSWNLSPKFTEPDTSVTRASVCLNSFSNAGHRVSRNPVLRAALALCECVYVRVYMCGFAPFLFCVSLLRSSLVPSSLFEDKRERSAPPLRERALSPHRGFIFFRVD